ncbi:MAG: T9SS type A sorting domain-containing protein [Flavobacteriaceae bacterium]
MYWKITTNVGDKVDNASGANFKADFTVDSSLSVEHFNQKATISIVSDEIRFFKNGAFEISIFNLAGKRIKQIENTFSKNHMLPLNLEKGVYIVQVREGQYLNNYKILVR